MNTWLLAVNLALTAVGAFQVGAWLAKGILKVVTPHETWDEESCPWI
jgi:hypothetical protein